MVKIVSFYSILSLLSSVICTLLNSYEQENFAHIVNYMYMLIENRHITGKKQIFMCKDISRLVILYITGNY